MLKFDDNITTTLLKLISKLISDTSFNVLAK